jgi:citrate lyase subunit beta/citryl-CoA lyase
VEGRIVIPRSYLYVPGDQPDKLTKARHRGADALILDLEDAVAPAAKRAARQAVRAFLDEISKSVAGDLAASDPAASDPAASGAAASGPAVLGSAAIRPAGPQLWVRINPGRAAEADIAAVWHPVLTGVMAAKTESADDLQRVHAALCRAERAAGVPEGSTAVVPLLESARAVLAAAEIAGGPRVVRLQIGEADLASELGLDVAGGGAQVLQSVRSTVVLAAAAAGLEPPVGPVSTDFRDLDALRRSTIELAGMGYLGRACIHPAQLAVVNEVFTPDPDALAHARSLLDRFDAERAAGRGVMVDDDGRMVDEAVVRRARRLVQLAGS